MMKRSKLDRRTFIELNSKGAVFAMFMPGFISQSLSSCNTVNESVKKNNIMDPNKLVDLLLEFNNVSFKFQMYGSGQNALPKGTSVWSWFEYSNGCPGAGRRFPTSGPTSATAF